MALAGDRAAGYYALTTGSIHKHETPERIAKGLANHPIGIVLLARLAVDRNQQGKGLGKALLFDALTRIAEAAVAQDWPFGGAGVYACGGSPDPPEGELRSPITG